MRKIKLCDLLRHCGSCTTVDSRYEVDVDSGQVLKIGMDVPLKVDASGAYNLVNNGSVYKARIYRSRIQSYCREWNKDHMYGKVIDTEVTKVHLIQRGSFVVGSIVDGVLKLSSKPVVHPTQVKANAEAERLAKSVPGTIFVVLNVTGTVTAGTVVWQ